jgi:hypothetical protein
VRHCQRAWTPLGVVVGERCSLQLPSELFQPHTRPFRCIPLAVLHSKLLLILVFAAIPLALYLHTFTHNHSFLSPAGVMAQNLKKFAPQAQATRKGPYTAEASGAQKVEGETIPRRNLVSKDGLKSTPSPDVTTMYEVLRYASTKFGNAKAVGARRIVNKVTETKKIKKMIDGKEQEVDKNWEYFELSSYTYKSFTEFEKMALAVGSAVQKLGFKPKDRMHLFAATSMQWLASAHGKHAQVTWHEHQLTPYRRPLTVARHCNSIRHPRRGRPQALDASDQREDHVH